MTKPTKNLGISLLELMLSLAIISIILIMATRYYSVTQTARQVQVVTESIQALYSADQQYYADKGKHGKISNLVDYKLLPDGFVTFANPWGKIDGEATAGKITFLNIPDGVCLNIRGKIISAIKELDEKITCDPGKLTLNFTLP